MEVSVVTVLVTVFVVIAEAVSVNIIRLVLVSHIYNFLHVNWRANSTLAMDITTL